MDARAMVADATDMARIATATLDSILSSGRGLTRRKLTEAADALAEAADLLREVGGGSPTPPQT